MRVLVCGGRNYSNIAQVFYALDMLQPQVIIEGGASGADALDRRYAAKRGVSLQTFPAEWEKYGNAAGPIRNRKMLNEGKPDIVVAFPGGRGTADMVRRAEVAGIHIKKITP
ncbi:DUF2493 domain-containing protein [Agrobacterium radiobacter]|uniref:DUF2493 domain-containing protein n=1 Tax=Agrobacterium tumefaciens complex TaxID=1183400 RepID=UPI000761C921|nr:DUF2493 domain-containing protein [Agrobacterium tumefaciens]KWT88010.1 hypothetical protein ASB65_18420 [Agrobacterium tumefaciens str. B6]MQB28194.1 DUF2493 domain-containing protein [Agrobacterium tumefaciens]NTA05000.1 DUF2493 domain-containing protein [Agrobacterium tumefaciens]NTA91595.1 DUF2493 domain-containing protein [Agrobacterium tumefaciens]NTB12745.1 DUF2493 domain-containing protein [Agrobacterium tumefaciens]